MGYCVHSWASLGNILSGGSTNKTIFNWCCECRILHRRVVYIMFARTPCLVHHVVAYIMQKAVIVNGHRQIIFSIVVTRDLNFCDHKGR